MRDLQSAGIRTGFIVVRPEPVWHAAASAADDGDAAENRTRTVLAAGTRENGTNGYRGGRYAIER